MNNGIIVGCNELSVEHHCELRVLSCWFGHLQCVDHIEVVFAHDLVEHCCISRLDAERGLIDWRIWVVERCYLRAFLGGFSLLANSDILDGLTIHGEGILSAIGTNHLDTRQTCQDTLCDLCFHNLYSLDCLIKS